MSCVLRLKKWETAPYSQKNLGAGHAQLLISEDLCNFRVRRGVGYASKNQLLDLLNIADILTYAHGMTNYTFHEGTTEFTTNLEL